MKQTVTALKPQLANHTLPLGASFFTVFLCMLFGANPVAVKISLQGLGALTTVGLRFSIAATTLLLWGLCTGKPLAVTRHQLVKLAPLALVFYIQLSLFYFGLNKTTASHGALIANVLPFMVMILAHFFIPGENITLKKVSGLIIGFTGVFLLFFDNVALTADALQGDLLILLAVLAWACNVVYIKSVIDGFHPLQITLYPMLLTTPLFLLSGFIWDGGMVRYLDTAIIQALLYQGLTASFGFIAWNTMIRKFGATALHSFVFIMPVSGVILGVALLDEPLTTNLLGSIVLVALGLIQVNRAEKNMPPS